VVLSATLVVTPAAAQSTFRLPHPDRAKVRVDGEAGASLLRFDGAAGGAWLPVCVAPCEAWVPRDALVKFDGDGMMESRAFELREDDVRLHVTRRSPVLRALGIVSILTGAASLVAGLHFFAFHDDEAQLALGATFTGVGLVSLVVGIALTLANGTSPVTQVAGSMDTGP
jgi:hypothetical protein